MLLLPTIPKYFCVLNISASAKVSLLPWRCQVWVRCVTCVQQPQEQRTFCEDLDFFMADKGVGLTMIFFLLSPHLACTWQPYYHFGGALVMKGIFHTPSDPPTISLPWWEPGQSLQQQLVQPTREVCHCPSQLSCSHQVCM